MCGIEIEDKVLKTMQEYAIQNIDEDTKGIYLGTFKDTIQYYCKNPTPFAGGLKRHHIIFQIKMISWKKL